MQDFSACNHFCQGSSWRFWWLFHFSLWTSGNGHCGEHARSLVLTDRILQGLLAQDYSRHLINIRHYITPLRQQLDWEAGDSPNPCSQVLRHRYVLQLAHSVSRCRRSFLFQLSHLGSSPTNIFWCMLLGWKLETLLYPISHWSFGTHHLLCGYWVTTATYWTTSENCRSNPEHL